MRTTLVLGALLASVLLISGCVQQPGNGGNGGVGTTSVTIENFAFSPSTITVSVGDIVTWTNMDATPHTVTADGGSFDSGNMAEDDTFSHTFNEAGTFGYTCTIHPYMQGTVIVE